MRSATSILALNWLPVSVAGGVRKAVGGFLRYVEFRDQHLEPDRDESLDGYTRYVTHRDRTSPLGRIFGRDGSASDVERECLVEFVRRSTKDLQPKWQRNEKGELQDHQRAVYRMILSPEDWRGLDLRLIARAAMRQLERDAGEHGLGPWFAAEHRNTKHHHVHIVLAARREIAPGNFATLLITRQRLQRMKDAIAFEIDRQRAREREIESLMRNSRTREGDQPTQPDAKPHPRMSERPSAMRQPQCQLVAETRWHLRERKPQRSHRQVARRRHRGYGRPIAATLLNLRGVARRYRDRMERELEQELVRADREGWIG
ncbi:MAG TPA: hypothetical protein VNA65_11245 [Candidatus Dormibacteraeota bacterium]|nr:hypothetical protein [Candidatus Dormibacteraeota bacterium]